MGVEYYLIKPYKMEKFELGKGSWPFVFVDNDAPLYMSSSCLHKKILG